MVSTLRRLAADHAALHDELPPNYLFPPEDAASDDLTQLTILLTGPQGTPYSQGLWRLHLKMSEDYPKSPPKASFRTRIWHPNVEELTGSVCVDTLKRDWEPKLTLKDVLITISCLLIHPNPDSALNSAAGALLQEDYDAFARQAKLMTSIHAPIPTDLKSAVTDAKMRGEDAGTVIHEQEESHPVRTRKGIRVQSVTMKKATRSREATQAPTENVPETPADTHTPTGHSPGTAMSDDENDDMATASKENDPSLSPSPVKLAPLSPRKNAHGKRPLSVLAMPVEHDVAMTEAGDYDMDGMTASEKNIAANSLPERDPSPQRKSPKLSLLNRGLNTSSRILEDAQIYEDDPEPSDLRRRQSGDGKENRRTLAGGLKDKGTATKKNPSYPPTLLAPATSSAAQSGSKISKPVPGSRKVSSSSTAKNKPRIGVRRL